MWRTCPLDEIAGVLHDGRVGRAALQELSALPWSEGVPQLGAPASPGTRLAAIGRGELLRALAQLVLEALPLGDVHPTRSCGRRRPRRGAPVPSRHPADGAVGASVRNSMSSPVRFSTRGRSPGRRRSGPGMDEVAEGSEGSSEAAGSEPVDGLEVSDTGPPLVSPSPRRPCGRPRGRAATLPRSARAVRSPRPALGDVALGSRAPGEASDRTTP